MDTWEKIKENGIFVGGHRKSGTTLFISLLDNHPEIFVYPYESAFWFGFFPYYANNAISIDEKIDRVESFIFKSFEQAVRELMYLDETDLNLSYNEMFSKFKSRLLKTDCTTKDFFDAILFSVRETLPDTNYTTHKVWVEKTTSSDIYANEIFRLYPKAKFIHILRDPRDMYSSLVEGWEEHYIHQYTCKEQLLKSVIDRNYLDFRLATENLDIYGVDKYLVVRYEDFLKDTKKEMYKVARFIGVTPKKLILDPSFCGRVWNGNAFNNKLFTGLDTTRIQKYKRILSTHEIKVLEYYFGEFMLKFKYTLDYNPSQTIDEVRKYYTWFNNNQTYSNKKGRYET